MDAALAEREGGAGFVHGLRAACAGGDTRVVMLVAPGTVVPDDAVFDVTLLKPVKRDALALALADFDDESRTGREGSKTVCADSVRGRVLVVDDNPMNVQVAVAMLERLSLEAHTASSGDEALALLYQSLPVGATAIPASKLDTDRGGRDQSSS